MGTTYVQRRDDVREHAAVAQVTDGAHQQRAGHRGQCVKEVHQEL